MKIEWEIWLNRRWKLNQYCFDTISFKVSCHVILYCIILWLFSYIIPYHLTLYFITWYGTILWYIILYHIILYCIISYYIVLCFHTLSNRFTLCHTITYYVHRFLTCFLITNINKLSFFYCSSNISIYYHGFIYFYF